AFEPVRAAQRLWHPDKTAQYRQYSQNDERQCHGWRRLVQVMLLVGCTPKVSVKSKIQHTEHVERGKHGRNNTYDIHEWALCKHVAQYFVFRKEAGKRRDARNSQRTDKHRPKRDR